MTSDDLPQPEPRDALVPPRPPQRSEQADVERRWRVPAEFKKFVNTVLDTVDRVAERIAVELGVREAGSRSSSSGPPPA